MKKVISVLLVLVLASTTVVYGSMPVIEALNTVTIKLNDSIATEYGKDYVRSDSSRVPSTIIMEGTTYVPIRLFSEMLGLDVGWDGEAKTVLLNNETMSEVEDTPNSVKSFEYAPELELTITDKSVKHVIIEDLDGNKVDVDITVKSGKAYIKNTYFMELDKTYNLLFIGDTLVTSSSIKFDNTITEKAFIEKDDKFFAIIPANPDEGFYYPYIISIMKDRESNGGYDDSFENALDDMKTTLMAEGSNEFLSETNKSSFASVIEEFDGWYGGNIQRHMLYNSDASYPLMMSMFPRPWQDSFLYTHSLDRDTLWQTQSYLDTLERGNLYRIDIQFKNMTVNTREILTDLGAPVDEEIYLVGFSASSDFATRMNYIHQDLAKAVASNAAPTLPITHYNGELLRFPLGMGDIAEITGVAFDKEKYKSTPVFEHTGSEDHNDGTYFDDGWGNYLDRNNDYNEEGIDYRRLFGDEIVARKNLINQILEDEGFENRIYKSYDGVDHGWNDEILDDIVEFLMMHE